MRPAFVPPGDGPPHVIAPESKNRLLPGPGRGETHRNVLCAGRGRPEPLPKAVHGFHPGFPPKAPPVERTPRRGPCTPVAVTFVAPRQVGGLTFPPKGGSRYRCSPWRE